MKFKGIEIGQVYNAWTVIDLKGAYSGTVLCRCECGKIQSLARKHLVEGRSKKCRGCQVVPCYDYTGQRIGWLTVLGPSVYKTGPKSKKARIYWLCECDCGKKVEISSQCFTPSNKELATKRSCGCNRFGEQSCSWRGYKGLPGTYWYSIQKSAKERGISFDLTLEELWGLFIYQDGKCAYTGRLLTLTVRSTQRGDASLDRIDSSKGYTIDNVQWVHKHINAMKLNHTEAYFRELCKQVTEHHKDQ